MQPGRLTTASPSPTNPPLPAAAHRCLQGAFHAASSVQLRNNMRTNDDEAVRKACYEGLRSIGPHVAGEVLIALSVRGGLWGRSGQAPGCWLGDKSAGPHSCLGVFVCAAGLDAAPVLVPTSPAPPPLTSTHAPSPGRAVCGDCQTAEQAGPRGRLPGLLRHVRGGGMCVVRWCSEGQGALFLSLVSLLGAGEAGGAGVLFLGQVTDAGVSWWHLVQHKRMRRARWPAQQPASWPQHRLPACACCCAGSCSRRRDSAWRCVQWAGRAC